MLPFKNCDEGPLTIYKIKTLAATLQPSSEYLRDTVDLLNAWAVRKTVKKILATNPDKEKGRFAATINA